MRFLIVLCASVALACGTASAFGCGAAPREPCHNMKVANGDNMRRGHLRRLQQAAPRMGASVSVFADPFGSNRFWARTVHDDIMRKLRRLQRSLEHSKTHHLAGKPFSSTFVVESFTDPSGRLRARYRYEDSDGRVLTDDKTKMTKALRQARAATNAQRRADARRRVIAAAHGHPEPAPTMAGEKSAKTPTPPQEAHQSHDVLLPAAATTATAGAVGYAALNTAARPVRVTPPASVPEQEAPDTDTEVVNTETEVEAGGADPGPGEYEFDTEDPPESDDDDESMLITDDDISETDYSPWTDEEEEEDGVMVERADANDAGDAGEGEGASGYFNTRGDFVPY